MANISFYRIEKFCYEEIKFRYLHFNVWQHHWNRFCALSFITKLRYILSQIWYTSDLLNLHSLHYHDMWLMSSFITGEIVLICFITWMLSANQRRHITRIPHVLCLKEGNFQTKIFKWTMFLLLHINIQCTQYCIIFHTQILNMSSYQMLTGHIIDLYLDIF